MTRVDISRRTLDKSLLTIRFPGLQQTGVVILILHTLFCRVRIPVVLYTYVRMYMYINSILCVLVFFAYGEAAFTVVSSKAASGCLSSGQGCAFISR
jgi:hypothetical protein